MPQINVVNHLPRYKKEDEAYEDPGDKDMGIISIFVRYIAEAQEVELTLTTTACCVDRKQDRPGDTATNETDDDGHFEVPEQEVAIKGVVLKDVLIRELRVFAH